MAEWFKASDLRPDINDAWVRTPHLAKMKDEVDRKRDRYRSHSVVVSTPDFESGILGSSPSGTREKTLQIHQTTRLAQ